MSEVERNVFQKLPLLNLESLKCVCELLSIQIDEKVSGKPDYILKRVYRYLNSEEVETLEDEGLSIFLKLNDLLKTFETPIKQEKNTTTFDKTLNYETSDNKNSIKIQEQSTSKNLINVHKLKDFKINGTIGTAGEKEKLSYTSLSFQIQNALTSGYSNNDICSAVIKAISPDNYLRNYLESRENLTVENILQIMRSHFSEKDSTSLFTEMSSSAQAPGESANEFAIRLMSLRQKVLILSKEEDCPYDGTLVRKRFLHALSTGLRNNNVRQELSETFKNLNVSDEELLKNLTLAVANESEHKQKLSVKRKETEILAIENQKDSLKQELSDLKASHVQEISTVRAELLEIKTALQNNLKEQKFRRAPTRCPNCSVTKARCNHCFCCGSADHIRSNCPHKKN